MKNPRNEKSRAQVRGVDSRPAGDAMRRHIHCVGNGGVFKSATHLEKEKVAQKCDLFFLAERAGFEPACPLRQTDFESSCKNRTWRNLTEYNGRCENPENAVFSRLCTPICVENAAKIRVRESPPILPSSNGFPEKPIRIFDRTERFFAPKSRFWQCVKSTGYARQHPKSCRLIRFKK